MAFSTVVRRPLNLLSTRWLARIHQVSPKLEKKIIENVTWRILTGRLRHWDRLPTGILSESLWSAGLPVEGETSSKMGHVITLQNLAKLAQESKNPKVLSMLCESVGAHIRKDAAKSFLR